MARVSGGEIEGRVFWEYCFFFFGFCIWMVLRVCEVRLRNGVIIYKLLVLYYVFLMGYSAILCYILVLSLLLRRKKIYNTQICTHTCYLLLIT